MGFELNTSQGVAVEEQTRENKDKLWRASKARLSENKNLPVGPGNRNWFSQVFQVDMAK